jgi:hypothetical protein
MRAQGSKVWVDSRQVIGILVFLVVVGVAFVFEEGEVSDGTAVDSG